MSQPDDPNPYESTPAEPWPAQQVRPDQEADATGGVIPYKNPHALIAYYLGIIGLLPCIRIVAAIPAIILGISGLKKRAENPVIKGSVHAWIGIIFSGLGTLISAFLITVMIIGIIASR